MNKKIKSMAQVLIIIFSIVCLTFATPHFLNFMEKQTNILNIPMNNQIENIVEEPKNEEIIPENIETPKEEIKEEVKEEEPEPVKKQETTSRGTTNTTRTQSNTTKTPVPDTTNTSGYIAFTATGYCPCAKCCGKTNGITASGAKAKANYTVAMSSKYKFGTKIEIKGMGTYVVQDRGGAIQGNKIDIYFNTHQEALNFGRRTVYLKVI